eukprot:5337286-Pyramimonas_sp.AAC.1
MARSNLSLRWVPTVLGPIRSPRKWRQFLRSQPPRDGEVKFESSVGTHCAGPPSSLRKWRQPPRDGEVQFESAVGTHCARPLSSPRKWR